MNLTEEIKRRSLILNTILTGMFVLSIAAFVHRFLLFSLKMNFGSGIPFWISIFFIGLFYGLLQLSRAGYPRLSAAICIGLLTLAAFQVSLHWGVDVPQTIAIYCLLIVMSGILINPLSAFVLVALVGFVLGGIFYFESVGFFALNQNWKQTPLNIFDLTVLLLTYFVIALISWLSSREIRKSLKRARNSEKKAQQLAEKLRKQKENLEVLVEKRTQQLKENQFQQLLQVNSFAKYGKIVSGILHDINNPLMVIALNLDSLQGEAQNENKQMIQTALSAAKNIESVIKSSRRQLIEGVEAERFDLVEEIKKTLVLFNHHFSQKKILLSFSRVKPVIVYGIPTKFSQVFSNILMNSIESFELVHREKYTISIDVKKQQNHIITIKISDNGIGILEKDKKNIFSALFSTRNSHGGTGLGLYFSQKIMSQYFRGKISFESEYGKGSIFTIEIPA